MMVLSAALIAFGVFLYVPAELIPLAGEGTMLAVAELTGIKFSTVKLGFDIGMVLISAVVCLLVKHSLCSVGVGTVFAAVAVGVILKLLIRLLGQRGDRILHRKEAVS